MEPMRLDEMMASALVAERVKAARRAQSRWAARPVRGRLAVLRRLRRLLAQPSAVGAAGVDLAACGGRASHSETLTAEILPLAEALRFLEREAEDLLAPRRPGGRPFWLSGVDLEIQREPLGVVLVIGPSNYPIFLPGVQTVQALAAGNAVLLKPGRKGTAAACALADLLREAGLPDGALGILPEDPEVVQRVLDCGGSVARQPGIDKVVLTGSAETGREVLAELAPRLVPAVMELSGCDAAFVRKDADLDRVVDALVFGLRLNAGATCIAPRRVFVESTLAASLADRLDQAAWSLPRVTVAPDTAQRARKLIREAVRLGARCLTCTEGPAALRAEAFPAVVLADVPPQAGILREDLFAPVISLVAVGGDDEALAFDELCPYALGATIFGREPGARALARRVRAGVVVINDLIVPTADPRLPFGGRGQSGFGVTRGAEGLLAMTAPKALAVRRSHRGRLRHLEPVTENDETLFQAFLALGHGDLPTRLRGGLALCRALVRRLLGRSDSKRPPSKEPLGTPANPIGRRPEEVTR